MRGISRIYTMLAIVLIVNASLCFPTEHDTFNETSKYLDAVRTFADTVLKYGRDTYGPKHTPLFVDGLNTETLAPVVWSNKGEKWILSNFANHQSLLRLLDGLTALTGDMKYRQAALDASAYALANLRTRNGLLYWGGHLGWDLQREKGVSEGRFEAHELREQSPYYELLWEANPSETKRLMETIWGAHVLDWSKLDFNRHSSSTTEPRPAQWAHEFDENLSCPFPSVGNNWSMANITGSLLHTGASLAKLGEHREALIWTKRLAQRWHSARHPLTGLCGGLLSVPQEKRARKFLGHKYPNISDASMIAGSLMDARYRFLTLCQMQVGEELGDDGLDLIRCASDDLKAFAHYAYDEESLSFRPLLTDGTELNWREFHPGYYSPQQLPQRVGPGMIWAYTTAYRLTRDPAHWGFLQSVWRGFDLGDLGTEAGDGRHLNLGLKATGGYFLYACLDLYAATEDKAFLMLAQRVADNILAGRTQDRCLLKDYYYGRTGDEAMFAVLHLAAALQGRSRQIPQPKIDRQYFHCAFSGAVASGRTETDARVWDDPLFYDKRKEYSVLPTGSTEPPISIREAISMGNMEIVRALYSQRTDFENMHSILFPAVQSGHKDAVEFFLAKGADVNSRNGWPEETPLHCAAALKDDREIIELLVGKGADLNAKNWKGDTPLQYAMYYGHEKIVELLSQKGATIANLHIASYMGDLARAEAFIKEGVDIDACDGHGYAPLHYAVQNGQKQVMELLLAKNADVNVKNWDGRAPLDIAASQGNEEAVELLLSRKANINSVDNGGDTLLHHVVKDGKRALIEMVITRGADLNARNSAGQTPLAIAVGGNRREIVELLIAKGAAVNAGDNHGATPLHVAAQGGHKDVAQLLIDKGADVDGKGNSTYIPLSWAIWNEDRDMIKILVTNGANVNFVAEGDWPFLHYLTWNNDRELVELFLTHGAKLNVKDKRAWTEFHIAVLRGNRDLARFLVSKGATAPELHLAACLGDLAHVKSLVEDGVDVDTKDEAGWTPLHWAASMAEEKVAGFLVGKGAGIDVRTNNDRTPLHQAATAGAVKLTNLLISKGADVNARDEGNGTPLHSAVAGGHKEVVQLLLKSGADVNVQDNRKRTPLDIAVSENHSEIVDLLRKQMLVHDVALTNMSVPSECKQGDSIRVVATVENRGDRRDSLAIRLVDVTADKEIGRQSVLLLGKRQSKPDLSFDTSSGGIADTGNRVQMNGDMNGDGYNDVLLNGPMWNDYRGRVFLYFGGPNPNTIPDMTFSGENPGDRLGDYGAITTGDLNKDGYDDVIVGAFGYPSGKNDGRVYIYYGGAEMDNIPDIVFDGETGQRSFFGLTLENSDIDQDGFSDLLVAAQNYDHGGEYHRISTTHEYGPLNGRGRVYLYWGSESMDTHPDIIFEGENRGDWFGRRISAGGDINGDGYNDILVGARHAINDSRGRAYLFWGNTQDQMNATCDWTFTGEGKNDNMGSSVCIFDIDSDGFSDVILGARFAADYAGRVYIHWGEMDFDGSKPDVVLEGEAKSRVGGDEIACGYFNADKYGDIIAGAWGNNKWGTNSGQAYLFYGNTKSLIDAKCDHVFDSEGGAEDWFGISVSAGDVNNDNYDDVLIGAPKAYDKAGRGHLYYGPFENTTKIAFNWDTTNASIGKHTLRVEIPPVPGEQNTEDNVKTVTIEVKEPQG